MAYAFSEHGNLVAYAVEATEKLAGIRLAIEPYAGKLAGFTTAQEIREFLAGEGIKATPKSGRSCAIAEYVRRESGVDDVRVTGGGISAAIGTSPLALFYGDGFGSRYRSNIGDKYVTNYECVARNTEAMLEFIVAFDQGEYPELETTE